MCWCPLPAIQMEIKVSVPIEYKGFKLMVTVETLLSDQAEQRWRGRFGFWKEDGATPQLCTISRPEPNPGDARRKALRIAKAVIDAERSRQINPVAGSHDLLARH